MLLINLIHHNFDWVPNRSVMDNIITALEAAAISQYEEQPVYYRYARVDDEIFIDVGNDKWDAIHITPDGWEIVDNPNVRFIRNPNMAALPYPSKTPDVAVLRRFINVASDEDFLLIVVWLIAAMSGIGPYTILLILGPQGSAKSGLAALLRRIIDPVFRAALRSMWRNEWDLAIGMSQSAVLAFDNISRITPNQSDAACRLATGSGFATRELWTKDQETVFDGMRPLIFNGISEFATRPDFLERCLVLVLPTIRPDQRRSVEDLQQDFEKHWPDIFAGLLDALSAVLKNMPTVKGTVRKLPRMADFALVAIAAEPACPWEAGGFLKAYEANQQEGQEIALESDEFAQIIIDFASRLRYAQKVWTGTATELRNLLVNPNDDRSRYIPPTPSAVSSELRRLQTVLLGEGVEVTFDRKGAKGSRRITIAYKPKAADKAASD
jgi:hypothetical protein